MIPDRWHRWSLLCCYMVLASVFVGASPKQSEVPPQAFFADYFSGRVVVQGAPPPSGIELIACIRDCSIFESSGLILEADGMFTLLEVNPADRFLRGDNILFYLVNAHGRIRSADTAIFEGKYAISEIQLNFDSELPAPMAPPRLPQVGDPILSLLPAVAIVFGMICMLLGELVIMRCRNRGTGL